MKYHNKKINEVLKEDLESNPFISADYEGWKLDYFNNFQCLKIEEFDNLLNLGASDDLLHIALNLGLHNNFIQYFRLEHMFSAYARLENKTFQSRFCENCTDAETEEGHDKCLMNLPGVINACCGHGNKEKAYVMFEDGRTLYGFTIGNPESQKLTKMHHNKINSNLITDGVDLYDLLILNK